ncbi:MAG: FkbM family methyltransferase [Gammaproteobacteria bacterium]
MTRVVEGLGRKWLWPDEDHECIKVIFDWMSDLDRAVKFCKQRRTAIQAGGNMGVWPWRLTHMFAHVVTTEPDPECKALMFENLRDTPNIDMYSAALMDRDDWSLRLHIEPRNRGAQYVEPFLGNHALKCMTIDSLGLADCDLIYLDIEGAELKAIQGAVNTIWQSKPVIAFEDKNLSTRFGTNKYDTEKWIARELGYKVVARYHNDVVMTCE